MKQLAMALTVTGILSLFLLSACGGEAATESVRGTESDGEQKGESSGSGESGGEHGSESAGSSSEISESSESGEHGEGSEHSEGPGDGEESGTQYGLDDTYDTIRAGARLIISYDRSSNAFTGTVENTTDGTLRRVRVEIHLSNGIELGPTTPVDLAPGGSVEVMLEASSQPFETWSAHPEVG